MTKISARQIQEDIINPLWKDISQQGYAKLGKTVYQTSAGQIHQAVWNGAEFRVWCHFIDNATA